MRPRARLWIALVCGIIGGQADADSTAYSFEWEGGGGFVMKGQMALPSGFDALSRIHETDVACFEIAGYLNGKQVGRWALGMLTPDTTWRLSFDPAKMEFLTYAHDTPMPQAWNMDGGGLNCGDPGFGFNIGNAAQDLCVDGKLEVLSQVPPPRAFPVEPDPTISFSQDACRPELLLGSLLP